MDPHQVSGSHIDTLREQDRFLPIANISRITKKVLPDSAKVSKDGKECIQECVSEFISFITSEACERCLNEKRKTVNGEDIIWAMNALGFDNYVQPMTIYLQKYRDSLKSERPDKRQRTEETADGDDNDERVGVLQQFADADASAMLSSLGDGATSSDTWQLEGEIQHPL